MPRKEIQPRKESTRRGSNTGQHQDHMTILNEELMRWQGEKGIVDELSRVPQHNPPSEFRVSG